MRFAGNQAVPTAGGAVGQRALLLLLSGNMLIDALEVSTFVVALPTIGRALHLSQPQASWLITFFALGFGCFIAPAARLVTRCGNRRSYLLALAVFAVASLVGALSSGIALLLATRVVKGACVALTAPTGLSIIAANYPEGPARNRALSTYSLFGASGFSAGLVLSGLLTMVGWRLTLSFSGVGGMVLYLFARRLIPDRSVDGRSAAADHPSAGRFTRRRIVAPERLLVFSAVEAMALNGAYWGWLLLVTYRLQSADGWSPLAAGLILLIASVPLVLATSVAAFLVARIARSWAITAGMAAAAAGYCYQLVVPSGRPVQVSVLPTLILLGAAYVFAFSALHQQAMSGTRPERRKVAGQLYQTSVQVGGAFVLALVALLSAREVTDALAVLVIVSSAGLVASVLCLLERPRTVRGNNA